MPARVIVLAGPSGAGKSRLVMKYRLLLKADGSDSLVPTWQYDWKAVFREPWIPAERLRRGAR